MNRLTVLVISFSLVLVAVPSVISTVNVSPSGGSGPSVTLIETYSDSAGGSDITQIWTFLRQTFQANPTDHACYVKWNRSTNLLQLTNDAGVFQQPGVIPGSNAPLSSTLCIVDVAHTSITVSGTTLTLVLPLTFTNLYAVQAGLQEIWMEANNASGASSDWQQLGGWYVTASGFDGGILFAPYGLQVGNGFSLFTPGNGPGILSVDFGGVLIQNPVPAHSGPCGGPSSPSGSSVYAVDTTFVYLCVPDGTGNGFRWGRTPLTFVW